MKMKKKMDCFLRGFINPIGWNSEGQVKEFSIYTQDEEDIILKGDDIKNYFNIFKNQEVILGGSFLSSKSEARVFAVISTKPLH